MALHLHTDKVRTTTLPHAVIPQNQLEDKRYSRVKDWPVSHRGEEVDMPSSALTVIESNLRDRREQSTRKPRKSPLNCSLLTIQGRSPLREWNLPYVRSTFTGPIDESNCTAVESRAKMPSSSITLDIGIHNESWGDGYGTGRNTPGASASGPPRAKANQVVSSRVWFVIKDVYYRAWISESARRLSVRVRFENGDRNLLAELAAMPAAARPALIVVDLNNANAKPLTLITQLRAKLKNSTPIIGFVSCVQGDLKMRGAKAGCDAVVSRPAFSRNLSKVLRRYGVREGSRAPETPRTTE